MGYTVRMIPCLFPLMLLAAAAPPDVVALQPFDPIDTSAGKLVRTSVPGEDQSLRLTLNGEKVIYKRDGSLELAYLVPKADAAGDDAVLVAVGSDVPADKACTKYLFLTLGKEKQPATAEFGDCSDQFSVERAGPAVLVRFTAHGDAWTFQEGKLSAGAPAASKPGHKKKKHRG